MELNDSSDHEESASEEEEYEEVVQYLVMDLPSVKTASYPNINVTIQVSFHSFLFL